MMSPWWRVVLSGWPRALPALLIVLLLFPSPQLQAHDVGPPLVSITPRRRIQLIPWTWEHWWEANRDLYLVPLLQAAAEEQGLSPEELAKLREETADALKELAV